MKRLLHLFTLTLIMAMSAIGAWAEAYTDANGIVYDLDADDKIATITGYTGTATTLEIPKDFKIDKTTYETKYIADEAFKGNTTLQTITTNSGGTRLIAIGKSAFEGCTSLKTFCVNKSLDALTEIGDRAFYGCTAMTQMASAKNTAKIGDSAFEGCVKLTKVGTLTNLGFIGDNAFKGCVELVSLSDDQNTAKLTHIGAHAFDGCAKFTTMGKNTRVNLATVSNATNADNSFKEFSIGAYAFYNCSALKEINNAMNITNIGESAFEGCTALETFTSNKTVGPFYRLQAVPAKAFKGVSKITELILASATEIASDAFDGMTALTKVHLPHHSLTDELITSAKQGNNNRTVVASIFYSYKTGRSKTISSQKSINIANDKINVYYVSEAIPYEGGCYIETGQLTGNKRILPAGTALVTSLTANSNGSADYVLSNLAILDEDPTVDYENILTPVLEATTIPNDDEAKFFVIDPASTDGKTYIEVTTATEIPVGSGYLKAEANDGEEKVLNPSISNDHGTFTIKQLIPKGDGTFMSTAGNEIVTYYQFAEGKPHLYQGPFGFVNQKSISITYWSELKNNPEVKSDVLTLEVNEEVPNPTITNEGTTYTIVQEETKTNMDNQIKTYYTINDGEQQEYSGPFTVDNRATITYWSESTTGTKSDVLTKQVFPQETVAAYDFTDQSKGNLFTDKSSKYKIYISAAQPDESTSFTHVTPAYTTDTRDKEPGKDYKVGFSDKKNNKFTEGGIELTDGYFYITGLKEGDEVHIEFTPGEDYDYMEYATGISVETAARLNDTEPAWPAMTEVYDGNQLVIYHGSTVILKTHKGMILKDIYIIPNAPLENPEVLNGPTITYNEADNTVTITPSTSNWEGAVMTTTYEVNYLSVPGAEQQDPVVVKRSNNPITVALKNLGKVTVTASCVSSAWTESTQAGIVIENATDVATITMDNEYMTYMPTKNITLGDSGLEAFIITSATASQAAKGDGITSVDINGTSLQLKSLAIIPAGTPVLLKGEAGKQYTLDGKAKTADNPEGNLLQQTTTFKTLSADEAKTTYLLAGAKGKQGFWQAAQGDELTGGTIFLQLNADQAAAIGEGFLIDEGLPTAIKTVSRQLTDTDAVIYNMQGMRVSTMERGQIYIVNGKKVVF